MSIFRRVWTVSCQKTTPNAQGGFQLVELMVVSAVLMIMASLITPMATAWWRGLMLEMAAEEVRTAMEMARSHAVRHQQNVAVSFQVRDDRLIYHALYRDGDGDGVRSADIESGIDPLVRRAQPIGSFGGVEFGFPSGPPPRDPGGRGWMTRLDDPIRFNRSDLASFAPGGTATPGSIYLTNGRSLVAVRISSQVAVARVLRYDSDEERWY